MSKASEREKEKQLGMLPQVATNRLVRKWILNLLKRLGESNCFRCGREIERVEELSIEHKKPWLHVDVDLFWDLDNVAVSHRKCNSGARRSRPKKWSSSKEGDRQRFARMYADPVKRSRILARRRELYALRRKARSSTVG